MLSFFVDVEKDSDDGMQCLACLIIMSTGRSGLWMVLCYGCRRKAKKKGRVGVAVENQLRRRKRRKKKRGKRRNPGKVWTIYNGCSSRIQIRK